MTSTPTGSSAGVPSPRQGDVGYGLLFCCSAEGLQVTAVLDDVGYGLLFMQTGGGVKGVLS
jgi:hypothetical protein